MHNKIIISTVYGPTTLFLPPSPGNMTDAWKQMTEPFHVIQTTWTVNKILTECSRLSENHLLQPRTTNSLCRLANRLLLWDEVFSYHWWLHRFIKTVTINCIVHFMLHSIHWIYCKSQCRQLPLQFIAWKTLIQNFN